MMDYQLFLGFPLHSSYSAKLQLTPTEVRSTFIQNHPDYLQSLNHEGTAYLGKFVGVHIDLISLDLVKTNIYSLLRRLVPDYPYETSSLCLIVVEET